MKKLALGVSLLVAGVLLVGCGKQSESKAAKADENKVVKLGVVGDNTDVWDDVSKRLKEEDRITIEYVKFTDYTTPNTALADKSVDLNAFQTEIFLDAYNEEAKTDLVPIGLTVIAPLGIYSNKIKDVSELKKGDTVTIPNDATNNGRALLLLQSAGVLAVDKKAGQTPTLADVTSNPLALDIKEVDAAQTARSLPDVDIAIINSGMAVDAGLTPSKDAIYLEPVSEGSRPYVNVIAARAEDKDNATYKKIVEVYQTEQTKKVIDETSKGSSKAAWDDFTL
ncbi:MetQ/NlpA family ABC transporter substrate-binding protein [Enterococcus bulliens]